jgi:DNA-binding transcriptional ArsR family regulator
MTNMSTPIQQLKSEFFKTMGHPARIRILEILSHGEHCVADLIPEVGLEPSHLSQQLGILRRGGLVSSKRDGSSVIYSLADERIADLLSLAHDVLLHQVTTTREQLAPAS